MGSEFDPGPLTRPPRSALTRASTRPSRRGPRLLPTPGTGAHPRARVGVVRPQLRHHLRVQKLEQRRVRHAPASRPTTVQRFVLSLARLDKPRLLHLGASPSTAASTGVAG